jgi:diamine N-acetyltransferase
MIRLRELRATDAPLMLEWMHDKDFQKCFLKNMMQMTLQDAGNFCLDSKLPENIENGTSLNYAVTDDTDEYLGTISLKNIDVNSKTAEYAISMRKKIHGKGIATEATRLVLKKAFEELGLQRVYLNVLSDNQAAIRLYEGCGFVCEGEFRQHLYKDGRYVNLKWYGLLKREYDVKYEKEIG